MQHHHPTISTVDEPAEAHPGAEPGCAAVAAATDAAGFATFVLGFDGSFVDANTTGARLFGLDTSLPDLPESLGAVLDQLPDELLERPMGGTWTGEATLGGGHDGPATHACTVHVRPDPADPRGGTLTVIARRLAGDRRRPASPDRWAEHDRATGLLNRSALTERLARRLVDVDAQAITAVAIVDIDGLADINDALGHDVGDRLVASVARRLESTIRPGDLVGRMGGDEFAVVCSGLIDHLAATGLGERLRRALIGKLTVHDLDLDVSVSVGVTMTQRDSGSTPAHQRAIELISHAHTALRAAKRRGPAGCMRFTDDLAIRVRARTELGATLSRAVPDQRLDVEYQPIFSAVSELAEGAQALLRWHHPTRGRLEAHEFIVAAEHTGAIIPIGDWVLHQACTAARRWIDDGVVRPGFSVHVDVTRLQLISPGFVRRVADTLRNAALQPRQLVLETRESSLAAPDADEVTRSIRSLRRLGVRVAIDSLGTSSGALSLLAEIGADVLKLDGSLALPTGASDPDTRAVRALVLLARALDMKVSAERVTGLDQLRRLRAAGCDLVQGDLLAPPAAASHLRPVLDV